VKKTRDRGKRDLTGNKKKKQPNTTQKSGVPDLHMTTKNWRKPNSKCPNNLVVGGNANLEIRGAKWATANLRWIKTKKKTNGVGKEKGRRRVYTRGDWTLSIKQG